MRVAVAARGIERKDRGRGSSLRARKRGNRAEKIVRVEGDTEKIRFILVPTRRGPLAGF